MKMSPQDEPLTDAELGRLAQILAECAGDGAMNPEEVDGFFAALMAGPEMVFPSEYLAEVLGGDMAEVCEFEGIEEADEMLGLLMRHWNHIVTTLGKDEPYLPALLEDENGDVYGNDWAFGFMRGVDMRRESWASLLESDSPGYLFPMLLLCHEHDPDPKLRPPPFTPEKREELLVLMSHGLPQCYRYFKPKRQAEAEAKASEYRRSQAKMGRNDPCPCGSGKKYKHCHGSVRVN
jgi:uncharacterized protein